MDAVIVRLTSNGSQGAMLLRPDGGLWDMQGWRGEYGEDEMHGAVVEVHSVTRSLKRMAASSGVFQNGPFSDFGRS